MAKAPDAELENCVKAVYAPFTDRQISEKIAEMLRPEGFKPKVTIIYQTLEGLFLTLFCPEILEDESLLSDA